MLFGKSKALQRENERLRKRVERLRWLLDQAAKHAENVPEPDAVAVIVPVAVARPDYPTAGSELN
jgi:hypothetical protein